VLINRILIAGLGSIGKRHLRIARELMPHADIRVLRHQNCDFIPEFSNGCFSSISQAIAFAPQIAVIASPATFHINTAQQLAESGVHLLVEKPLSASTDSVTDLLETCRERGLVLLTGYNLRFLPSLNMYRDLLRNGVIGKIISVRCEVGQYLPSWRPETDYRDGVSACRELGGGVLLELSHELDYIQWIFGEVDWVRATLSRQSNLEIDVEDSVHIVLGFAPDEDGRRLIGTVNLDFIRHDSVRNCSAIGENGTLRWNASTGVVEHYVAGANEWNELFSYQQERDESYLAEWQHFLRCINVQQTPLISGEDGLQVLHIIDAARQSTESGTQITIKKREVKGKTNA